MHAITTTTSWRLGFLALGAVLASEVKSFAVACDEFDSRIVQALDSAKGNRHEIELFLANYASSGDHEKADAARWLVANMDGHGFAVMTLIDKEGACV
jgi:sugar/nucleoside kinase (ribokinase family)